ncbi:hypothetical protein [Microbacterium hominis]|uniref:hypothetical protein n=1 Tax=Microbacterium hominis TaxID=162426 RepID=UPI0012FF3C1B|nr:hypothetical protein [Microbacterium hominis]
MTRNSPRVIDVHEARQRLLTALLEEADLRSSRNGFDDESGELEWVVSERQRMLAEVNGIRRSTGADPVTAEQIKNAERPAIGHSDYATKFALYCAELALRG